jgi:hypothetical protein
MGTPLYMDLGDACRLVQDYAELHTNNDVLAALKDMQMCYDDLDKEDKVAYNMFMDAGQRMFAPKQ